VERGRGGAARDGSPIEVYKRLPVGDVPHLIHGLHPGGAVLDLGAGVGRLADPLIDLGHRVVAVDESAAMLGEVKRAETVLSRIETLDLGERFDVVLLASHLINSPDDRQREQILRTVNRHLAPAGRALIEWHPPEWFDTLEAGVTYRGQLGDLMSELVVEKVAADLLTATVRYLADDLQSEHRFRSKRLTRTDLQDQLHAVGLELIHPLDERPQWLMIKRRPR
jgi:SAM-dependent methyltransferase